MVLARLPWFSHFSVNSRFRRKWNVSSKSWWRRPSPLLASSLTPKSPKSFTWRKACSKLAWHTTAFRLSQLCSTCITRTKSMKLGAVLMTSSGYTPPCVRSMSTKAFQYHRCPKRRRISRRTWSTAIRSLRSAARNLTAFFVCLRPTRRSDMTNSCAASWLSLVLTMKTWRIHTCTESSSPSFKECPTRKVSPSILTR